MSFTIKLAAGLAALSLPFGPALAPRDLAAQTVSGEAFGTYVRTTAATQQKSPLAALQAGSHMSEAEALSVSVPNVLDAKNLFATTTGGGDTHDASAESSSTLESVDILGGIVKADLVVAIASSAVHGTTVRSNADGSTFANLVVNGTAIAGDVAPNTAIEVPGVGTVIVNEQVRHGDGVTSTGITVNMIRVVLKDALTGATTGEVIAGSARSSVTR